jgi:hypothetical protein
MHPFHRRILSLAERRHVIGGLKLLGLFYLGPYLPSVVTLLVFLAVACMATANHADGVKVAFVAAISFVVSMAILWLNARKSLSCT